MEDCSKAFSILQPICARLPESPSKELLQALKNIVSDLPCLVLQPLQEYVLFPLSVLILNKKRSLFHQDSVDIIELVLNKTTLKNWAVFSDLFQQLFILISCVEDVNKVSASSEELKLSVVKCVIALFKSGVGIKDNVYEKTYMPKLAHGIYVCLLLATHEKHRELRIASITCISTMVSVTEDSNTLRDESVVHFLPNIASKLSAVTLESDKENHKVIVCALSTWTSIVCLVMDDYKLLQEKEWYSITSEKLTTLFQSMVTVLTKHQHWKVRFQMVTTAQGILNTCTTNLRPTIPLLIETLVSLSTDDFLQVSSASEEYLQTFATRCQEDTGKELTEVFEENVFVLATRLPRLVHSLDDKSQLSTLRLLSGYLNLLSTNVNKMLHSSVHMKRLLQGLLAIVQLDMTGVGLLEERFVDDSTSEPELENLSRTWKPFKQFDSQAIHQAVNKVCFLLGKHSDTTLLFHYFLDFLHETELQRKEVLLLLNEVVKGVSSEDCENLELLLEEFFDSTVWNCSSSLTLHDEKSSVITMCLLLEGVGNIATIYGPNFSNLLVHYLYPIIERTGSNNCLIASAGFICLRRIAKVCGFENVCEFLQHNVDYFAHSINVRLRNLTQYPEVPSAIKVVVKYGKIDILPCIQMYIEDMLLESLDANYGTNAMLYLNVFHAFVMALNRQKDDDNMEAAYSKSDNLAKNIQRYITEYEESQNFNMESENDIDTENIDEENIPEETEVKKKVPPLISMTVHILERTVHLLPKKNKFQQLLILEILKQGLLILRNYEDELLPIVHKIWSPLINRFTENDPVILSRCFELLSSMGRLCGNFVRKRTLQQALPNILLFLNKQSKSSYKKDSASGYTLTHGYKLQMCILRGIGQLVINLELLTKDIDDIMNSCIPYLSEYQPPVLQELSIDVFRTIMTYDYATVWLKLCHIGFPNNSKVMSVMPNLLSDIELCGDFYNKEYVNNVQLIFLNVNTFVCNKE